MFITISQMHPSAPISFSINARKASSVQDTTAFCLSTGNINFRMMIGRASADADRPIPIVLVKCWKVAHWNAKKLLKDCQKSKKLLPKFQKLLPKFLAIFM